VLNGFFRSLPSRQLYERTVSSHANIGTKQITIEALSYQSHESKIDTPNKNW
jgi:hypothetical protein